MHNTLGLSVGTGPNPTGDSLEQLLFREPEDPMDQSPPLFSGDKDVPVPGGPTYAEVDKTHPEALRWVKLLGFRPDGGERWVFDEDAR